MKKTKTIVSVILALAIFAAIAATAFGAEVIGTDSAKAAALAHAGLTEQDVTFIRTELEYDNGTRQYDIDFNAGVYEYDYDIDAYTGAVRSSQKEYNDDLAAPQAISELPSTAEIISMDDAKNIALDNAGFTASEVTFKKARLDYDDGIAHYDIEFKVGTNKIYDYEIDGATGAITDFDYDEINYFSIFNFLRNLFAILFSR